MTQRFREKLGYAGGTDMDLVTLGQVLGAIANPDVGFDNELLAYQSSGIRNGVQTYREGALKESASAIVMLIRALRHDINFLQNANPEHVLVLERKMRELVRAVKDKRQLSRQHGCVHDCRAVTSVERIREDTAAAAAQADALLLQLERAERYHTQLPRQRSSLPL